MRESHAWNDEETILIPENLRADFGVEVDFNKDSEKPSRVFRTMAELVDAFVKIDELLLQSIDVKIQPVLILEDIEAGSLKAWFRTILESIDDDAIKNLDWKTLVGTYLVDAKYILIDFMNEKTEISNRDQIEALSAKLIETAKKTDVLRIPAYEPVHALNIGKAIERISESVSHLEPEDKAKFVTTEGTIPFNVEFNYSPEDIEELLTSETITSHQEMILKVKKPDYLGDSMWDFRHEGRMIHAKVMDVGWLEKFQRREVEVRPGDSIRAKVQINVAYGYDGEVIRTGFTLTEVTDTLPFKRTEQRILPLSVNEESPESPDEKE